MTVHFILLILVARLSLCLKARRLDCVETGDYYRVRGQLSRLKRLRLVHAPRLTQLMDLICILELHAEVGVRF